MKKVLLSLSAAFVAMTASAAIDNMLPANASTFENGETNSWFGWGGESTRTIAEGGYESNYCFKLYNPAAGSDYYAAQAAYQFETALEQGEYIFSFYAKSEAEGGSIQVAFQNSETNDGGGYKQIDLTTDWNLYTTVLNVNKDGMNRILINFGKVIGTYYIDDIVFGQDGAGDDVPAGEIPEDYVLLASGNQTDWNSPITAYQSEFSNTTYDGHSCIKFENATAGDNYSKQLRIDLAYAPETMYYITFDVIAEEASEAVNSAWYQYVDEDNNVYQALGYNDFNTFTVSDEWEEVILKGKYTADAQYGDANRVVLNLGAFVGTMYITNIKVYGPAEKEGGNSAVEAIEAVAAPAGVYNLMGVKVASDLNGVAPGIYIVDGKKVLVRK